MRFQTPIGKVEGHHLRVRVLPLTYILLTQMYRGLTQGKSLLVNILVTFKVWS